MQKQCFKCGETKSVEDFYAHPAMADGRLGKCKECSKRDVSLRIEKMKNNPEWLSKERARCREKQEHYRQIGVAKKTTPETRIRWIQNNPQKAKAHQIASTALRFGRIEKKSACETCGAENVRLEKHHPDYSSPLKVQWLCTKCHGKTRRLDCFDITP